MDWVESLSQWLCCFPMKSVIHHGLDYWYGRHYRLCCRFGNMSKSNNSPLFPMIYIIFNYQPHVVSSFFIDSLHQIMHKTYYIGISSCKCIVNVVLNKQWRKMLHEILITSHTTTIHNLFLHMITLGVVAPFRFIVFIGAHCTSPKLFVDVFFYC